jgi:hypothetical protein
VWWTTINSYYKDLISDWLKLSGSKEERGWEEWAGRGKKEVLGVGVKEKRIVGVDGKRKEGRWVEWTGRGKNDDGGSG